MRLKDITKSLTDYEGSTKKINVNGRTYRISPDFVEKSPNAFVGQSFGAGEECNRILAKSIEDARDYYNKEIPIFAQTEIGNFLRGKISDCYLFGATYEGGESSQVVSKVDSFNILKQMRLSMDKLKISKEPSLFFVHPAHMYRVVDQGRIFGIKGGVFITEEVYWPMNDPQKWVRNQKEWKKREIVGRLVLWLTGKVKREF